MRGLGRIPIRSGHAHGLAEIECRWMQILEEDSGRIRRFDKFERTSHVGMRGLGRISIRVDTLVAFGKLNFGGCESLKKILEGLGSLTSLKELHVKKCEAPEEFPYKCARSWAWRNWHLMELNP